jgi:hypothetical protein
VVTLFKVLHGSEKCIIMVTRVDSWIYFIQSFQSIRTLS